MELPNPPSDPTVTHGRVNAPTATDKKVWECIYRIHESHEHRSAPSDVERFSSKLLTDPAFSFPEGGVDRIYYDKSTAWLRWTGGFSAADYWYGPLSVEDRDVQFIIQHSRLYE